MAEQDQAAKERIVQAEASLQQVVKSHLYSAQQEGILRTVFYPENTAYPEEERAHVTILALRSTDGNSRVIIALRNVDEQSFSIANLPGPRRRVAAHITVLDSTPNAESTWVTTWNQAYIGTAINGYTGLPANVSEWEKDLGVNFYPRMSTPEGHRAHPDYTNLFFDVDKMATPKEAAEALTASGDILKGLEIDVETTQKAAELFAQRQRKRGFGLRQVQVDVISEPDALKTVLDEDVQALERRPY